MGVDLARYHGWSGNLRSPWFATLAIVRVALMQILRRKSYWIVLAMGFINFIMFWAVIYAVTQFEIGGGAQERLLRAFGFSAHPVPGEENGFVMFIDRQSVVVMMLLAFSGSLLVGSDFRNGALPFYLSRRIDRRHYIVGKILAISAVISILTIIPALALFFEYGMFTSSYEYWLENWQIPLSVISYGLVICAVMSILLVTLSAYLQRAAPIAITWSSLFVLLRSMANQLRSTTENENWRLIDPWNDMRLVGKLCFGTFADRQELQLAWWALLILTVICSVALAALVRRVRAVDVVAN